MGTTQSSDDSVSDSMEPHTTTTIKASLFEATYSIENIYDDDENDNQETNDDGASRVSFTLEEDVVLDDKTDPTFPWLPILECVAETLGCGVVRTYNLAEAKTIMLSASRYPLVVPDLILLEEEREEEEREEEEATEMWERNHMLHEDEREHERFERLSMGGWDRDGC